MNTWKNIEECIKLVLASRGMEAQIERITEGPTLMAFSVSVPQEVQDGEPASIEHELGSMMGMKGMRVTEDHEEGLLLIEIPKPETEREAVNFTAMVEASKKRASAGDLRLPIGSNAEGKPVVCDLTKLRHLLIAGDAGAGKSTLLDAITCSLIAQYTPEQVRLILCEPKADVLQAYEGVPHLITGKNVHGRNILDAIGWACIEMRRRFDLLEAKCNSGVHARNVCEYNENLAEGESPLPYLVVVADDCSEIMAVERRNTSYCMDQLFHMSRATGIFLILATDTPSEKVFRDALDSDRLSCVAMRMGEGNARILPGHADAEKLLGSGDLLLRRAGVRGYERVQAVSVTQEERAAVIAAAKENYEPQFDEEAERVIAGEEE